MSRQNLARANLFRPKKGLLTQISSVGGSILRKLLEEIRSEKAGNMAGRVACALPLMPLSRAWDINVFDFIPDLQVGAAAPPFWVSLAVGALGTGQPGLVLEGYELIVRKMLSGITPTYLNWQSIFPVK